MAKPNRFDVARKVGELSPATRESVAQALGVDASSPQLQTAFEGATKHGLVESGAPGADDESATWTLSEKGRTRLEQKDRDS